MELEERTEQWARRVRTPPGGEKGEGQYSFSHLGAHGSLHPGFGCPLVGIMGSAQLIAFPTKASFWLLDGSPDTSLLLATGLPVGLIGTVRM